MNLCIGVIYRSMADPGSCITETSASAWLIFQQISILSILYVLHQDYYISNENSSLLPHQQLVTAYSDHVERPFEAAWASCEFQQALSSFWERMFQSRGNSYTTTINWAAQRLEGELWLPTWLASTNLSSGFHMVFLLYLKEGQKERKEEHLPLLILWPQLDFIIT